MSIHGHETLIKRLLEQKNTKSFVLVGPASVGKWTVAEHVINEWGVTQADLMMVKHMTVEDARDAVLFSSYAPVSSPVRVVLARIGRDAEAVQNILLKALEEAPVTSRFILVTNDWDRVLPTLSSRCWLAFFSLLSTEDLTAVLEDRGFKPAQARVWAERGQGQVKRALAFREVSDAKPLVAAVVKSFREKDPLLLDKSADGWTDAHTDLLVTWCNEAITRHWNVFSDEEAGVRGRAIPMKMLMALRTDVRPKLVVKSVLADLLRSMA